MTHVQEFDPAAPANSCGPRDRAHHTDHNGAERVRSDLMDAVRALGRSLVTEDPPLLDALTVDEHLGLIATIYELPDSFRETERLLAMFDLTSHRQTRVGGLSRELRQRLAVLCAYLSDPRRTLSGAPSAGPDEHDIRLLTESAARANAVHCEQEPRALSPALLSLVVPVYFEEECIERFIAEATAELDKHRIHYEIVFVDDGSRDRTVELIKRAIATNPRIRLVEFSYNHGKESAVTAGFTYAQGDYLLYMDPDLQDPPDEIINFVTKIQEGYDLVFGVRNQKRDTLLNVWMSKLFWFVLERFTGLKLPRGLAVMRICNRRFADQFLKYGESNRFIEGLFMNIGMKQTQIPVSQRERFAGVSKFNFRRKMKLAFKAIFDYSDLPLKLATRFGVALLGLGMSLAVLLVVLKLFVIDFQLGWPSLVVILITGFGIQLFFLGVIGVYVGNIYRESKRRPLFSVRELTNIRV